MSYDIIWNDKLLHLKDSFRRSLVNKNIAVQFDKWMWNLIYSTISDIFEKCIPLDTICIQNPIY